VYEAPVRLWHWINALAIAVLIGTGYLIASPPPTQPGDANSTYLFGYVRYAHFVAGQIVAVAFLYRVYWAFVGNAYARQLFALPVYDRIWRWACSTSFAAICFLCATRRNTSATIPSPTR
jgi:Ni/Fe-hydrogenase 1 B-type cytochrome subunit